jgi:Holliday junction DNA helicase RuvA
MVVIRFLRGKVFRVGLGFAEIDVGGVGYLVWLTESHALSLEPGTETLVYTHQYIREDAQLLYGFETEEQREWFELMLGVSGIGPKGALQIVSSTQFDAFYTALVEEDVDFLCTLPGIGKKTAGRLIVELKDKFKDHWKVRAPQSAIRPQTLPEPGESAQREVLDALKMLGYSERQVFDVVRSVFALHGELSVEHALRLCLQQLDRSRSGQFGVR